MPTKRDLEARFWKALKSDMTMMLGLVGAEDAHARPMTAQLKAGKGPVWFFTAKNNTIVKNLKKSSRGVATFISKKRDLYATVHGKLTLDNSEASVDKLWNPYVAAWFEKGKEDPKLALLRFDLQKAEIWLDDSSIFAGIKLLIGLDPKKEYKNKVAKVNLK